jgi:tRNA A-37 threonylcarbamoyl transferase component Bud32
MAEVYAGLNIRTGKRVALKWISPALATTKEALSRFRREALAAGRINHPNVVTVFDVVEHASSTWLVMELLEGDPLSEILNRVGYMEPEPAVQLLIPAIRGVAAAHAHGVIHRDLTPDNIFICRSADGKPREAKVLDFGVSKLADDASDQVGITGLGHAVGTPAYMAPEQIRGNIPVDARTDVYALGVVLYQMLAGRRPFDGQIYSALMIEIATTDPPRLTSIQPHVPVALDAIVHRAMARDMDQRFPDVKTFLEALEDLVRVDVSYAPNKISAGHSGRVLVQSPDRGSDRLDASGAVGRAVSFPLSGGAGGGGSTAMDVGPVTPPPPGTPILGRAGDQTGTVPRFRSLHRAIPIAAAFGLVEAVIALAVVRARHEVPREREEVVAAAPRPVTPPPKPAGPALSELVVVVSPPGAKITVDGMPVEGNPYTGHFRRDRIHEIGATAVGYEPKTQGVVLAKDLVVTLSLDRKKSNWPPPHGLAIRRALEPRRSARGTSSADADQIPDILPVRAATSSPSPAMSPAPAAVSPSGGHAPVHPIQTTSPYETP